MAPTICPTCSCTEIDIVDVSGEAVCVSCGTIVEENNIVSSIEFHESGGGAHSVVGQFVSASATKSYGNVGTSGRNYGMESRANTLANGKKKIRQIAGMLRLGDHYVDSAFRLYALALQRNFTHGRKASTVIAACLYIVCRRERSPHLLIDFSDKLQLNVYVLGGVFLKFCKLLQIHLPLIDPSLYIHRFASQLNFGAKTHSIATTALRLVATMKRDWIETGRRPSGICGAALLIAARSQSVMCSLHDVMDIVNIGERTLKQRLYEFSLTPTAQLTYDQVGRLEMSRVECDPPSFQRHREKEVMEMLLIESERLPLENGSRKRGRRQEEEDVLDGSAVRKLKQLKDEDMSRFLGWESTHKKRPSGLLSGGGASSGSTNGASSAVTDDAGAGSGNGAAAAEEEDIDEDDDDDDEIDYGFENANDQIVNRASRLAAQEVLTRVRRKSVRYIMRKREEADFYKTIERDLTLALEEENRSASSATSNGNDAATATDSLSPEVAVLNGKPTRKEDARLRRKTSDDMSYASRQLRRRQGRRRDAGGEDEEDDEEEEHDDDGDGDYDDDERDNAPDEVVDEEEDEEEEEEEDERSADRRLVVAKAGHRSSGDRSRDDANLKEGDSMSDLDDDEINSLLLTKEEADKKKILWEKMNADYIKEQEEKRINGLNQPDIPKKRRKKKVPDVNAPPPDTAQHAIYKLKSRRINYEVIDELFGEAASNGF